MSNELNRLLGCYPDVEDVEALIARYPYALEEKDDLGWLPLHVAMFRPTSYEVVELLINKYPYAAYVHDDEIGSLPLHYAAERKSKEVVQLLIDAYPDALEEENDEGNLPLHYAVYRSDDESVEVIHLLIEEYPDAVKEESYYGGRPLDLPHVKEIYDCVMVIGRKKLHPELSEENRPRWSRQAKAKNYLARVRRSMRISRYNRVHHLDNVAS